MEEQKMVKALWPDTSSKGRIYLSQTEIQTIFSAEGLEPLRLRRLRCFLSSECSEKILLALVLFMHMQMRLAPRQRRRAMLNITRPPS